MRSSCKKTLQKLLDGVQSLDRRDVGHMLRELGYNRRIGKGSHTLWQHPAAEGTLITWKAAKETFPIFGFQMNDLRSSVNKVLDHIPNPLHELPRVVRLEAPPIVPVEKEPPTMNKTAISAKNYPADVAELVYSYQQKEIKGRELVELLNSSGYVKPNGKPFQEWDIKNSLIMPVAYRNFVATKEGRAPIPPKQGRPSKPMSTPPTPTTINPNDIIEMLNRLNTENEALRQKMDAILAVLKG